MPSYKTPGVYVEEISKFPPSVAQVATAIPAFIGSTEKGEKNDPKRISNMVEFEQSFGGPEKAAISITIDKDEISADVSLAKNCILYPSLQLYFQNGGGPCYIVSTGGYGDLKTVEAYQEGVQHLEKVDEPTLIILPEAHQLSEPDYGSVIQSVISHCAKMKDRFGIFDFDYDKEKTESFRGSLGTNELKYGAVYTPFLQTIIPYAYDEDQVILKGDVPSSSGSSSTTTPWTRVEPIVQPDGTVTKKVTTGTITTTTTPGGKKKSKTTSTKTVHQGDDPAASESSSTDSGTLASLRDTDTQLYNRIKALLATKRIVLPPSPAMAGIYARVDRQRGVWKAPANVSVASIIGPVEAITNEEQEGLNVDPTSGKSINAIRTFAGKGTIVWGARTLAGNDNEWRYVNVRRLFITVEESVQKATAFAVFEPNDATTWLKVKAMIDSYLYGLWQQGALAGAAPEDAYFVHVGLGKTMTPQDILEGRLIIEIGIAAVRPAEFIILRFSHKLQES